jgi:O-antigen ligase
MRGEVAGSKLIFMPINRYTDKLNLSINYLLVTLALLLPVYRRAVSVVAPLLVILWLIDGPLKEKYEAIRKSRLILAVLLFILLNLVSLLWSDNLQEGFSYVGKYRYLLLVPVAATSLRPRFLQPLFLAFLGGITVSLAWSYGIFTGLLSYEGKYPVNPAPTMSHLDYSIFLAFAALLTLNLVVKRPLSLGKRALGLGLFFSVVVGLLFNLGRSGQLAFFGTLLIVLPLYLNGRPLVRLFYSAVAVILALNIGYATVPIFTSRVDAAVTDVTAALLDGSFDSSMGERIASMIVSVEIFEQHPLLGTGAGDNMVEFRRLLRTRFQHLEDEVAWYPHMHNQYLQTATELGLIGLLVMLNIFAQMLRERPDNPEMRSLAIVLASVFLLGFVGDPFFHKQLPLVLFSLMAGVLAAERGSRWWPQAAATDSSS